MSQNGFSGKKISILFFFLGKIVYIWSTKLVNQFGKPK